MKKNFFKKLSFVLAFAMVATTVAPVGTASAAAKTPNLAKRYANVYEGTSYSYGVKDAAGYTVKWAVSGKGASYASLSKASGTKTVLKINTKGAAAAKNAPVVVTAKFYKGKKLVKSAGDSVTVKVSATAVDIVTKADVTKFPTGEAVKFSRKITPANATSVTYWSVTDKDGKATTDATIDKTGNLTVNKLGDYVVVAETKNAKNGKVIAKDTQEVTAVLGIVKATQQSVTKLDVEFNGDMKDAKAVDFSIVNDDNKTTAAVKSVTVDGKKVTVETFAELNDGKSYTVTYKDITAQFVATDGKVASIAITPATVPAGVATEIKAVTKDANGVILKENPYQDVKDNKVTFDISEIKTGYTDRSKLVLNEVGDTAKASATYHTWKYEDGKEVGTITAELTITAVDKSALGIKEYKLHVGDSRPSSWSTSVLNDKLALEDANKNVYVYIKDSNDEEPTSGYKLESSNKDVLLLSDSGNLTASVTAVATGTAYVLVKDVDGKILLSLPISIVAKRKVNRLVLGTYNITLSNATDINGDAVDIKEVSVKAEDQYGDKLDSEVAPGKISVTCVAAPSGVNKDNLGGTYNVDQGKVTFTGSAFSAAGTYNFNIKVGDYTQTVAVVVKVPSGTTVNYELIISDKNLDLKVDSDTTSDKNIVIKVAIKQGEAIIGYLPLDGLVSGDRSNDDVGFGDMVEIKRGSDVVTGAAIVTNPTGTSIVLPAISVAGSSATKLLDTGSYSIRLQINKHKITNATTHAFTEDGSTPYVLSSGFSIIDSQSAVTYDIKKDTSSAGNIKAGIIDAIKFFYEGNELTGLQESDIDEDATQNGNQYHVKSVKVTVNADGVWVPVKVVINRTITLE